MTPAVSPFGSPRALCVGSGKLTQVFENDLKSRQSFTLFDFLFASVVGNVPGAKLLLTLPVK